MPFACFECTGQGVVGRGILQGDRSQTKFTATTVLRMRACLRRHAVGAAELCWRGRRSYTTVDSLKPSDKSESCSL